MDENKGMTAKQLIRKIQKYVDEYGDFPLSTCNGFVRRVDIHLSKNDFVPEDGEIPDEFCLDIITE